jgi:hypothetical protein
LTWKYPTYDEEHLDLLVEDCLALHFKIITRKDELSDPDVVLRNPSAILRDIREWKLLLFNILYDKSKFTVVKVSTGEIIPIKY